jgi:hypothetical protein
MLREGSLIEMPNPVRIYYVCEACLRLASETIMEQHLAAGRGIGKDISIAAMLVGSIIELHTKRFPDHTVFTARYIGEH